MFSVILFLTLFHMACWIPLFYKGGQGQILPSALSLIFLKGVFFGFWWNHLRIKHTLVYVLLWAKWQQSQNNHLIYGFILLPNKTYS